MEISNADETRASHETLAKQAHTLARHCGGRRAAGEDIRVVLDLSACRPMIRQAGTNRDWQFRFEGYMIVGSNMLAFAMICFTARQDKTPG
jgi:VirK protein